MYYCLLCSHCKRWGRWTRVPNFITCIKMRSKVRMCMRARSIAYKQHARLCIQTTWKYKHRKRHIQSMLKQFILYCDCCDCCCRHPGCCLSATAVYLCFIGWLLDGGNANLNVQFLHKNWKHRATEKKHRSLKCAENYEQFVGAVVRWTIRVHNLFPQFYAIVGNAAIGLIPYVLSVCSVLLQRLISISASVFFVCF